MPSQYERHLYTFPKKSWSNRKIDHFVKYMAKGKRRTFRYPYTKTVILPRNTTIVHMQQGNGNLVIKVILQVGRISEMVHPISGNQ